MVVLKHRGNVLVVVIAHIRRGVPVPLYADVLVEEVVPVTPHVVRVPAVRPRQVLLVHAGDVGLVVVDAVGLLGTLAGGVLLLPVGHVLQSHVVVLTRVLFVHVGVRDRGDVARRRPSRLRSAAVSDLRLRTVFEEVEVERHLVGEDIGRCDRVGDPHGRVGVARAKRVTRLLALLLPRDHARERGHVHVDGVRRRALILGPQGVGAVGGLRVRAGIRGEAHELPDVALKRDRDRGRVATLVVDRQALHRLMIVVLQLHRLGLNVTCEHRKLIVHEPVELGHAVVALLHEIHPPIRTHVVAIHGVRVEFRRVHIVQLAVPEPGDRVVVHVGIRTVDAGDLVAVAAEVYRSATVAARVRRHEVSDGIHGSVPRDRGRLVEIPAAGRLVYRGVFHPGVHPVRLDLLTQRGGRRSFPGGVGHAGHACDESRGSNRHARELSGRRRRLMRRGRLPRRQWRRLEKCLRLLGILVRRHGATVGVHVRAGVVVCPLWYGRESRAWTTPT
mmetsp:Transcript_102897/g.295014  ORF Transcript_102897/g.295014 Transcript_102897/m.295014 type:complete len:502 (+) Transcript_102897:356-1861(+)